MESYNYYSLSFKTRFVEEAFEIGEEQSKRFNISLPEGLELSYSLVGGIQVNKERIQVSEELVRSKLSFESALEVNSDQVLGFYFYPGEEVGILVLRIADRSTIAYKLLSSIKGLNAVFRSFTREEQDIRESFFRPQGRVVGDEGFGVVVLGGEQGFSSSAQGDRKGRINREEAEEQGNTVKGEE